MLKWPTYHPLVFYIFVIIGAFLLGIIIFNAIIAPALTGRRDIVIVPDIRGISLNQANSVCRKSGLNIVVIGKRFSDELPEGFIVEQDPLPQEGLKEGRAIKVVVSKGPKMEIVPDLRNVTLREAELSLKSAGLNMGRISRIFAHEDFSNQVLETFPTHGSHVMKGGVVDILLLVGNKPRRFLMPNLVGMDLPFVRELLQKRGFTISRIVTELRNDEYPNKILSQRPGPGEIIEEGGAIEFVVSTVK